MNLRTTDRGIRAFLIATMCALGVFGIARWISAEGGVAGWMEERSEGQAEPSMIGTARRPLVIVSGQTEQIPTADYVSTVGGLTTNATAAATPTPTPTAGPTVS